MNIEDQVNEAFERDMLYSEISDTHKDLYGIRPRWINPAAMTTAELVELRDRLVLELGAAIREAAEEQAADERAQKFYREPIPMATFAQLVGRA